MASNTVGAVQEYSLVPAGTNAGKPAVQDALSNGLDTKLRRQVAIVGTTASQINTDSGILDVAPGQTINITMDANIAAFDVDGLDSLVDVVAGAVNADGLNTIIRFIQDGAGSRTVTVAGSSKIDFGTSFGTIDLSSSAGRIDVLALQFDKTLNKYFAVAFSKGHNQ